MIDHDRMTTENDRQYRVIDQSLSSYATLRDRCECRAHTLNVTLVGVSLFLCSFAFMGDNVIASLGYDPSITRFTTGIISAVILVLSVMEYVVEWKRQAARYGDAAGRLASLKALYRQAFSEGNCGPDIYQRLTGEYNKVMATLPPIPNREFTGLKAAHEFKRLLSQRISDNPKAPRWVLRLQLRIEGVCYAFSEKGKEALSVEDSRDTGGEAND